ncbi:MAG: LptA/OstA family protein [Candidatus Binataceae bacterium]
MINLASRNANPTGVRISLTLVALFIAAIFFGLGFASISVAGTTAQAAVAHATPTAKDAANASKSTASQSSGAAGHASTGHAKTAKTPHAAASASAKDNQSGGKSANASDNSPFPEFSANHGPINIRSDSLSLDYQNNTVLFKGHVRVVQAGGVLTSNSLLVKYNKDHEIERAIADGNVRMSQGGRWVTSDHAVLNQLDHTIALTGNPVAHNGGDQVTGTKITVYLQSGKSVVDGDARAVFFPRPAKNGDNQLTRCATGDVQSAGGNQVSADPAP